jgi:predicted transcriptional regulator/transcriptional regulator with XRE-family HTH domain
MAKIFVGSRLRRLRREQKQSQAEMAKAVGVSTAYINLLENNQRSLSVKVLTSIADAYGVDWRDLIQDDGDRLLADLRMAVQDPLFDEVSPDLQELRAAVDHAPVLTENFLRLYDSHSTVIERIMRAGGDQLSDGALAESPEAVVHDFFKSHANHFPVLDEQAEALREREPCDPNDVYFWLKTRFRSKHKIDVVTVPIDDMDRSLRIYDEVEGKIELSEALDFPNRTFQLAHMLALIEYRDTLDELSDGIDVANQTGRVRCRVELANYFAAAFLMPYTRFRATAESLAYDINRLCKTFDVSFEQVCHRLTTLQRQGDRGIPFFFIRVDRAGNVTKRFTASSISIAEYGGACPVWDLHAAFSNPGTIIPQFVELPDGKRFFTISRTADRPAYSRDSQARRQAVSLGCEMSHAEGLGYAQSFNVADELLYAKIGINCRICPRQSCSQRAHNPLAFELSVDPSRRGDTRLES